MVEPSQALDNLTNTFTADRKFFDALMAQSCGEAFVEMCVWFLWLHEYLHDIQSSLHEGGKSHGALYQAWVRLDDRRSRSVRWNAHVPGNSRGRAGSGRIWTPCPRVPGNGLPFGEGPGTG